MPTCAGISSSVSAALLELREVTKRYRDGIRGEVIAVRDASLRVEQGTTVVLRGASGAGKSTLLGLCAGLVLPTSGDVLFRGEVFSRLRERFRARTRRDEMGVVLQALALVPRMSVIENVLLAGVPTGAVGAKDIARAMAGLERFGIAELANARIETLSGGEKQRVALTRALLGTPALLLLDEPTAHVDAAQVATLIAALREHAARGGASVVATHDERVAEGVGGGVVMEMRRGTVEGGGGSGERG